MSMRLIVAVGGLMATLNGPSLDAAQKCGGLPMDPACAKLSSPRPNVTFGQPKPAPVVPRPTPDAGQLARIQELQAALAAARERVTEPAIDCKMVVNPPTDQTTRMPVVLPTPDVRFSLRVVPIERCPAGGR